MILVSKSKFVIVWLSLAMSILLQACGFTPVYQEGSSTSRVLNGITLDDPRDGNEYEFLKAVEDRIPRAVNPIYRVKYRVRTRLRGVPVQDVKRRQIVGTLNFEVISLKSKRIIISDKIETFTSFTDEGDLRFPQEKDAVRRATQILADRFVDTLMIRSSKLVESAP